MTAGGPIATRSCATSSLRASWRGGSPVPGVTANCLHPGFVASRFGDNNRGLFRAGLGVAKRIFALSVDEGAETPVYCATSPELDGVNGLYFGKCRPDEPSAAAQDDAAALRLWQESARIAGLPAGRPRVRGDDEMSRAAGSAKRSQSGR